MVINEFTLAPLKCHLHKFNVVLFGQSQGQSLLGSLSANGGWHETTCGLVTHSIESTDTFS